ncbi:MAG: undecaprenyl-diphosphate phosphatase [bacterium]
MEIGQVFVLAIVQGLTEFLPISSSGHLVAARMLFDIPDAGGNAFDAFLHLGTLLAVLLYYWRVWWGIGRGLVVNDGEGRDKQELAAKLAIATVPAAVVGYLGQNMFGSLLRSSQVVAGGLLLTGIVLLIVDVAARRTATIRRASFGAALFIGLAQVVALVPGVSRSGMTMAAGRAWGLSRGQAATFSFLLSAPIIAGAGLASLLSLTTGNFAVSQLLIGLAVSFLAGLAAIRLLLRLIKRVAFWPFIIYLFLLSGFLLYVG